MRLPIRKSVAMSLGPRSLTSTTITSSSTWGPSAGRRLYKWLRVPWRGPNLEQCGDAHWMGGYFDGGSLLHVGQLLWELLFQLRPTPGMFWGDWMPWPCLSRISMARRWEDRSGSAARRPEQRHGRNQCERTDRGNFSERRNRSADRRPGRPCRALEERQDHRPGNSTRGRDTRARPTPSTAAARWWELP